MLDYNKITSPYNLIDLMCTCLLTLKTYEIFPNNIFLIGFDKNWFPDGCLEINS